MIDLEPACHRMAELLAGVTEGHLARPTPCAEYTVADVVDHVALVAEAFVALARKEAGATPPSRGCVPKDVAALVRALGGAWAQPSAWEGSAGADPELPAELWGRIALTEMVVHGWDLARATGQPVDLPEETLRACYEHVAAFVPNAPVPGLWGPAVEVPADAPLLDRIVAVTGRTPSWLPRKEAGH